jgi:heme-degrading monooxygenase HmoA
VIARHWRGWTALHNADEYESLLRTKVLPGLSGVSGYRGGYVFRQDRATEAEFVVVNFFESIEAVKQFAGEDYETAVFEPEALALLMRREPVATHYDVRVSTVSASPL